MADIPRNQSTESSAQLLRTKPSFVPNAEFVPGTLHHTSKSSGWSAGGVIAGTFLLGVLFALGHDRYNHALDGCALDTYHVSQQWVQRIETAFAFLVKMFFAAAVTTAYAQLFWHRILARSWSLQLVDHLMAAPTDVVAQINPRAWLRAPGLMVLAATVWLMPLAAIVTPATLTVVDEATTNVTQLPVPQFSYNYSTWVSIGPINGDQQFLSASPAVLRTSFSAATGGAILAPAYAFANQSYTLNFSAPAVSCAAASSSVRKAAEEFWNGFRGSAGFFTYISWVGSGNDINITSGNALASTTLDTTSPDAARLFVFSMLYSFYTDTIQTSDSVIECVLHNASYAATFSTVAGVSRVTAEVALGTPLPALASADGNYTENQRIFDHYVYQATMDAFGKLLVGDTFGNFFDATATYTSYQLTSLPFIDINGTAAALEELFQNITLSLFSNSDLILNNTQAARIPALVTSYFLAYRYAPANLWIAYGVAGLVSLLISLAGMQSAWAAGASYSSKFSTVVRVAKYVGLHGILLEDDKGADPLPRPIGKSRLGGGKRDEQQE